VLSFLRFFARFAVRTIAETASAFSSARFPGKLIYEWGSDEMPRVVLKDSLLFSIYGT